MPASTETDRPVLGLVSGGKYSLIIDSGNSPSHAADFLKEIGDLDIPPVKYLVLTHYHWDHVFGIKEMDLMTIASEKTKQELSKMKGLNWDDASLEEHVENNIISSNCSKFIKQELADRESFEVGDVDLSFNEYLSIDLGGLTCNLYSIGGTHTDDSTVIHIPEEKVLFLGDCIYGRRYNGLYGYDKQRLSSMMGEIDKHDAQHYLASHESVWREKELLDFRSLLKTASDIADESTSVAEALEHYKKEYGCKPSEDEAFCIECFLNANKAYSAG